MFRTHGYLAGSALAATLFIATPACAAQTYGYRGGYQEVERGAYDNGYREGVEHGREDARKGRDFSYARHGDYRDADDGYRRAFGDREFYRRIFRQGFQTGYTEAFNRVAASYGRVYPRNAPYPPVVVPVPVPVNPRAVYGSPAAQIGYRDGIEVGRNDARDRERYDPARSRRYRSADNDYDRRYGSLDEFRGEYRAAFERGYADGYRDARR